MLDKHFVIVKCKTKCELWLQEVHFWIVQLGFNFI